MVLSHSRINVCTHCQKRNWNVMCNQLLPIRRVGYQTTIFVWKTATHAICPISRPFWIFTWQKLTDIYDVDILDYCPSLGFIALFTCEESKACIPIYQRCDGFFDCLQYDLYYGDESDEINCSKVSFTAIWNISIITVYPGFISYGIFILFIFAIFACN